MAVYSSKKTVRHRRSFFFKYKYYVKNNTNDRTVVSIKFMTYEEAGKAEKSLLLN